MHYYCNYIHQYMNIKYIKLCHVHTQSLLHISANFSLLQKNDNTKGLLFLLQIKF